MIIGIDASNIRAGGGITHLKEILSGLDPEEFGISKVIIWGGKNTLELLPQRKFLDLRQQELLNRSLPFRLFWQNFVLTRLARKQCGILFVPGGSYLGKFHPFVTMSRNMLPFEDREIRRYSISLSVLRLYWLRFIQLITFIRSDGIVFLNRYAYEKINQYIDISHKETSIIPHGIDKRFFKEPRPQHSLEYYSFKDPINLLYVSDIVIYKHQEKVVEAVYQLRRMGIPVKLTLVGKMGNAGTVFQNSLDKFDPLHEFTKYLGEIDYSKIEKIYHKSDIFIFASSCENLPNILLEAMASGLPLVCSNFGPMPEVLKDGGVYFDPENPAELSRTLKNFILDPHKRQQVARRSYVLANNYSWSECTNKTFSYLVNIAKSVSLQAKMYQ